MFLHFTLSLYVKLFCFGSKILKITYISPAINLDFKTKIATNNIKILEIYKRNKNKNP